MLYVGCPSALYAISNAGSIASNKRVFGVGPSLTNSSSAIGSDSTVYFIGGISNALLAVSPDGNQRWAIFKGGGGGTPAIGLAHTIYFQDYTGFYAITPSGDVRRDTIFHPKTSLMLALALGLTAGTIACASEPAAGKATDTISARAKPRFAAPRPSSGSKTPHTGSYLPREVRRSGMITDGPYNVAVIDSDMIQNSGASDLQQLLVRRGFGH